MYTCIYSIYIRIIPSLFSGAACSPPRAFGRAVPPTEVLYFAWNNQVFGSKYDMREHIDTCIYIYTHVYIVHVTRIITLLNILSFIFASTDLNFCRRQPSRREILQLWFICEDSDRFAADTPLISGVSGQVVKGPVSFLVKVDG